MKKLVRRGLALLAGLALLSACTLLPDFAGQMRAGKYDPAVTEPSPNATASMPKAEAQTEPHTCGMHAARSLYLAYGLDPDTHRLRFRLGTDQPAMRADKDSAGTLHPDLYRVLAQDGFSAEPIDLGSDSADERIDAHLRSGQLCLAVVYRSTYHWVLLVKGDQPGALVVVDSLEPDAPRSMPVERFLADALSVTLVEPAPPGDVRSVSDAHAAGLAEMARLYQRK